MERHDELKYGNRREILKRLERSEPKACARTAELIRNRLFLSPDFSDLSISCGSETIHAHKLFVGPQLCLSQDLKVTTKTKTSPFLNHKANYTYSLGSHAFGHL